MHLHTHIHSQCTYTHHHPHPPTHRHHQILQAESREWGERDPEAGAWSPPDLRLQWHTCPLQLGGEYAGRVNPPAASHSPFCALSRDPGHQAQFPQKGWFHERCTRCSTSWRIPGTLLFVHMCDVMSLWTCEWSCMHLSVACTSVLYVCAYRISMSQDTTSDPRVPCMVITVTRLGLALSHGISHSLPVLPVETGTPRILLGDHR